MFSSKKSAPPVPTPHGATTIITSGTTIRGDLSFSGAMYIDGRIEGTIKAETDDANLTQGPGGIIEGEVHAPCVVLHGEVRGNVYATQRLELRESSKIEGDIFYNVLEMAAGAKINGKMVHQTDAPKRLPAPGVNGTAHAEPA
ncbi:bactofilin family protein [Tahibacter amnicola]|uniref:Polymer-forming cytoskeletal protein n=1 Tax=Tahibacter amnicola TaxID=2976241 RepID=A0ABY6BHM2_9GAMM|nr:polymer-forming cytoskeletal protein [Tahibacter amnicola]UXI68096.1 polymer-forming cytoskeletal protein [Tahibacter amnicola]